MFKNCLCWLRERLCCVIIVVILLLMLLVLWRMGYQSTQQSAPTPEVQPIPATAPNTTED